MELTRFFERRMNVCSSSIHRYMGGEGMKGGMTSDWGGRRRGRNVGLRGVLGRDKLHSRFNPSPAHLRELITTHLKLEINRLRTHEIVIRV
jgi:hypothetical protein